MCRIETYSLFNYKFSTAIPFETLSPHACNSCPTHLFQPNSRLLPKKLKTCLNLKLGMLAADACSIAGLLLVLCGNISLKAGNIGCYLSVQSIIETPHAYESLRSLSPLLFDSFTAVSVITVVIDQRTETFAVRYNECQFISLCLNYLQNAGLAVMTDTFLYSPTPICKCFSMW